MTDPSEVEEACAACGWKITTVLSGTARGVDRLGEQWAEDRQIPVEWWPANWERFGRSAGYHRNEDMAKEADALVAIWDGTSRGTKHMIDIARRHGLRVFVRTPG